MSEPVPNPAPPAPAEGNPPPGVQSTPDNPASGNPPGSPSTPPIQTKTSEASIQNPIAVAGKEVQTPTVPQDGTPPADANDIFAAREGEDYNTPGHVAIDRIPMPEGMSLDQPLAEQAQTLASKLGLNQNQLNAFMGMYVNLAQQRVTAELEQQQTAYQARRAEIEKMPKETLQDIFTATRTLLSDEEQQLILSDGAAPDALTLKLLAMLGKSNREANIIPKGGKGEPDPGDRRSLYPGIFQ